MIRSSLPLKSFAAVLLAIAVAAFAPGSAFAQHGGHGGGGHAGGGFGGHSGGFGGSHSSGSSHSSGRTHSAPTQSGHPASTSAPASPTDNAVVHTPSFGTAASGNAAHSTAFELRSEPAPAHNTVIGFPPADSHIAMASGSELRSGSGALSFSGQGHTIWQNEPASRTTSTSTESQRVLFGRPQSSAVVRRPVPPHRIFGPPTAGPILYYYPAFGFYPFGFFGNGFCDPFWGFDPTLGCGAFGFGYGYGGFGYGYGWGYPGYYGGYGSAPDDSFSLGAGNGPRVYTNDTSTDDYGTFSAAPSLQQQGTDQANEQAAAAAPPSSTTVIYMKDGTNFGVMSYWLDAGKLHYVTNYGGENTLDMGQLDLQRTVDENARAGVDFTLKPAAAAPQQ